MDLNTALLKGPEALIAHYSEEIEFFARSKANPRRILLHADDLAQIAKHQVTLGFYSLSDKSDIQYVDSFFRRCIRNSILSAITKEYYKKRGSGDVIFSIYCDSRDYEGDAVIDPFGGANEDMCTRYSSSLAPSDKFYETIGEILRVLPYRFHTIFLTLVDAEFGDIHKRPWSFLAKRLDMTPRQFSEEVQGLREALGDQRDIIFTLR